MNLVVIMAFSSFWTHCRWRSSTRSFIWKFTWLQYVRYLTLISCRNQTKQQANSQITQYGWKSLSNNVLLRVLQHTVRIMNPRKLLSSPQRNKSNTPLSSRERAGSPCHKLYSLHQKHAPPTDSPNPYKTLRNIHQPCPP